jgi:hypothetical protein
MLGTRRNHVGQPKVPKWSLKSTVAYGGARRRLRTAAKEYQIR